MTTTTEKSEQLSIGERIAIGVAVSMICSAIGTVLCPGAGTLLGAKIGAVIGGGSAS